MTSLHAALPAGAGPGTASRRGHHLRYSDAELRFIESHHAMPRKALHAAFVQTFGREDVGLDHIKNLCSRRGWSADRRRAWTPEQDAELRAFYPDTPTAEVAQRVGHTLSSTYQRARKLDLPKSEAYLASPAACRLRRGDHVGAAFRFQQGQTPANKGLRRPGWAPGRMKENQFTPGQNGWNWWPIGSERLADGYRWTKVSDLRRVPWTINWKPTHILLWEKANGPVPAGHAVVFANRDRTDIRLDNLECLSRADLMRRNSVHNLPAPLPQMVQLIGAVNRKINRRRRHDEEQDRGPAESPVRGAGRTVGPGQTDGDRAGEGDRGRGARSGGLCASGDPVPQRGRGDEGDGVHRAPRGGASAATPRRELRRTRVAIRATSRPSRGTA